VTTRVVLSFNDEILTEVELTKAVTVVGRHPACDIVIDHPAISGRHMLFRVIDKTVYAEDLASTNGTKVNGLTASHQVIHHLDLIEVGRHKLHYFDDTLLAGGGVGNLESTVLTEYERTMIAANVPEASAPVTLPPSQAPKQASARRGDEDVSRTLAIPRATTELTGAAEATGLALKVVAGDRKGEVIALNQANTMIGPPGGDNALVIKRGAALYLARFSGSRPPRLNRKDLGPGTHAIAPQDVIDVGGSTFEVIQVA
jgi:FHA domain